MSVQMFFMDLSERARRDKTVSLEERKQAEQYYLMIGLACQGRGREANNYYAIVKKELKDDQEHLKKLKPLLTDIAKIAKKVLGQKVKNMEVGESVGEYEDRKLSENLDYMQLYNQIQRIYLYK